MKTNETKGTSKGSGYENSGNRESGSQNQGQRSVENKVKDFVGNAEQRLQELQSEWSFEKIMTVATAGFLLVGAFMGAKKKNKLNELGASLSELLGVDSLREWEPPKGVMKKLGIRRQDEIDAEISRLSA